MAIIFIDLDDTLVDFKTAYEQALIDCPDIKYPNSQYGLYANLKPLAGAIDAVSDLSQHHDVWFLSAPSVYNPLSYTEKRVWVEKHFGFDMAHKLILCSDKSLLMGDYLIDDQDSKHNQHLFQGEHIHFGTTRYPDWDAVLSYLFHR